MSRVVELPTRTTVRISAISGVHCDKGTICNVSSGVLTARAKITGRSSPQASFRMSSVLAKPSGRDFDRGL